MMRTRIKTTRNHRGSSSLKLNPGRPEVYQPDMSPLKHLTHADHHHSSEDLEMTISSRRHLLIRSKSEVSPINRISLLVVLEICFILVGICHRVIVSGLQLQDAAEVPAPMKEFHQHNNILKFSVEENKPPNTFVGQIRSADQQIPYMILPWPSKTTEREIRQALSYNSTTGELHTLATLDREHRDQYYFVGITKEPFAEIKCSVEVVDVNDNAPKFQTPNPNDTHIVIDMPEGQSGYRHKLPMAYDYDSTQFGIKEFRITSGNTPSGTFLLVESGAPAHSTSIGLEDQGSSMLASDNPQLRKQLDQESSVLVPSQSTQQSSGATPQQSTTPTTKFFYIDLEANVALDRENQSSYTLQVEAIDGGSPAMFGRLVVTVNVLDINDNDPSFPAKSVNNPYEISLPENTTRGSLIYTVRAYDVDLGPNGQVNYSIKRVIPSSQQNVNSTNSDYNNGSNEVLTNKSPSNIKPRGQQAQPQLQSTNKIAPAGNQRTNLDYADINNFKVRATQQEQPLFDMDAKKGEIYLAGLLDYEQDQMHELIIEARDNGKPSRSSQVTIKVYVIDTKDEPPAFSRGGDDNKRQPGPNGGKENSISSALESRGLHEPHLIGPIEGLYSLNLSQINSSMLFVIVFAALVAVAFTVCLVKMKSRQPESDYNDTAGLTSPSNNGQAKTSPSHSTSNIDHANGLINDSLHHHHHDRLSRRGPNMGGSFNEQNIGKTSGYDSSSNHYQITYPTQQQRPRHHSSSSRHLLPDLASDSHQIPSAAALLQEISASRGGTMTLSHNTHLSHHQHLLNQSVHHHSLDHHHNQFAGGTLANSLAYAHSQATLLHPAHHLHNDHHHHHHQSTHHLSHPVNGSGHLIKGGTMNSVGTQNSAHHHPVSSSPMPATPTTIHSSIQQVAMQHDPSNPHNPRGASLMPPLPQVGQLPPTSATHLNLGNVFSYPPSHGPGSILGCYPDGNHHLGSGGLNDTPGSTMDSCSSGAGASAASPPPLDRWTDLGVPAQLVSTQDWCGTYNWDHLEEWTPEYHTVLPLIQSGEISATNY